MATKIGFKVRDKAIIPDVSPLFDLSKTLLEQEDTREKQRQTWRDEQDALRKSQTELTPTVNQDANQFFGKFSQGIIDESLDLQKMLESGQINSSNYSAQWRNLNQSNEQMIAAQTSYQETAQKITEDVANGISSEVNTKNLNHFNKVFQPGAMEVERDGRGGLRLFNKKTGDIVSPSYLSNLTNSNLPLYDYMKVADTLVKQFGVRGITDAAGNTIKGVYANMDEGKLDELMLIEAKALLDGAQAPIVSILVDGMGHDVVYNEDELKDGSVYRKPDGTFAFSEKDKEKAEVFMRNALKNALPLEKKEAADPSKQQEIQNRQAQDKIDLAREKFELEKTKPEPLSDAAKTKKALRKKEIGYLKSIDNIISGDSATAQSSIDALIQGANVIYGKSPGIPNIVDAVRSKDGKTLTITRRNSKDQTISTPYDISDPNKAGEVMVELFFPNVKGSYEELLKEFNAEGGFTTSMIKNPDYKVNEKGVPLDLSIKPFIPNPNYKGNTAVGKTAQEITIEEDFNKVFSSVEDKLLKEVIDNVDMNTMSYFKGNPSIRRSNNMAQGAEDAFTILKIDLPNLDARVLPTKKGLVLTIPSLFEGDLLLRNRTAAADKTNYVNAIKQIFNSIAKGLPFEKSKFE